MYRDILQQNVLDLFRDLLQKPSLTFTQLKQFMTYLCKQSEQQYQLLSSAEGDTQAQSQCLEIQHLEHKQEEEEDEEDEEEEEEEEKALDLDLHHAFDEDEESDECIKYKGNNSSSSILTATKLNILLNDTKLAEAPKADKVPSSTVCTKLKQRYPLNLCISPSLDTELYGTLYCNKYSSVNQCSPSPNVTEHEANYELPAEAPSISPHNSTSTHTLHPDGVPFDKFHQLSHSDTYQSQYSSTSMEDTGPDETERVHTVAALRTIYSESMTLNVSNESNGKSRQHNKQQHCNKPRADTLNQKWTRLLSAATKKAPASTVRATKRTRTNSLSAFFHSFITHKRSVHVAEQEQQAQSAVNEMNTTHEEKCSERMNEAARDVGGNEQQPAEHPHALVATEQYVEDYGISCLQELIDRLNHEELKYGRDNGQYLILNAQRILNEEFEPTFIDLLQCHVRSTGLMFENHVRCKSLPVDSYHAESDTQTKEDIVFRVVDVGGHRNERKKWSYVLQQENDAIVFVVSAASFCQVLFEDFKKNAMRESLDVWQDIMSKMESNHDRDTQFLLIINKIDLFYQRCHLFTKYFPEYDGDTEDKHEILDYIKSLYLDIAKKYNKHNVYCVCTKLTDSMEITCVEAEKIKHTLLNYNHDMLSTDIVNIILEYSIGDVFWSEQWLKPMWQRKMAKLQHINPPNKHQSKHRRKNKKKLQTVH